MATTRKRERFTCTACNLPHSRLVDRGEGVKICPNCWLYETVGSEKAQIGVILEKLWEDSICAYCGEAAEHVEHVIPRWTHLPTYTVPACAECNLIAGGTVFTRFSDKRDFIRDRLQAKYRQILDMPEWDEEELAEMGYGLRSDIEHRQQLRAVVIQRLDWDWVELAIRAGMIPAGRDIFEIAPPEAESGPMSSDLRISVDRAAAPP